MEITVEGWFNETHNGAGCRFLCIHTAHYGFSVTDSQVEQLVSRLTTLLDAGQCLTDGESVMHVDWSEGDSESVMIAFRPGDDCQGRYYDIPKETAANLLTKLRERLSNP
jgi:cation transport regulator ChaC